MNGAGESPIHPLSVGFIKACEEFFRQFSAQAAPGSVAFPAGLLDAWKGLAQGLGASTMDPGAVLPTLGPAREHLEITQKISELGLKFQRSYAEFTAHLSGIQQEAMRAVRKTDSPATYDEWIDSAETAYASLAHGATFARLLADLCNTLSALKVERGKLLEYFSRQLDLPTRAEIDSLHQQVRLLRGQLRGGT
jgi:hypothetical protein